MFGAADQKFPSAFPNLFHQRNEPYHIGMKDRVAIDLAHEIAALLEAKADLGQAQTALGIVTAMLPSLGLPPVRAQELPTSLAEF